MQKCIDLNGAYVKNSTKSKLSKYVAFNENKHVSQCEPYFTDNPPKTVQLYY